jgi:uncharacterized phiE125 gp8 family phage protein
MKTLIMPPETEPLTLDLVKANLKIDDDAEDELLMLLIPAARQSAENLTGQTLATSTWRIDLPAFPRGPVYLPLRPVQEIVKVEYISVEGERIELLDACFWSDPLQPAIHSPDGAWPATKRRLPNAVQITVIAGMADVPAVIKSWLLVRIATAHKYREGLLLGSNSELPPSYVDRLLDGYCVVLA